MKLTKKSGGVVAAVVMAGGLTAASATSAFADSPAHSPKTAAAAKGAEQAKKDAKKHAGRHHRLGMHGERTVKGKDGKTVVQEWQAGTVTAVSGHTVTVKSADGFTMTWTLDSATKMRAGTTGATAKVGDKVLVEGVKSGSVNQARVVVDRTDRHAAKAPGKNKTAPGAGKHRKPGAPPSHDGTSAAHNA
ncbi:MAG: hypothetical protein HOW97_23260 [Catenulispora sp.]|nr:hypothetical protein [Catenulispora sp.]